MKTVPASPKKWIDLIKVIINFFLGRRRLRKEKKAESFKKTSNSLKKQYNDIDERKSEKNEQDLGHRLNNMFD